MAGRKRRAKRDKPKAHEWERQLREVLVEAVIHGHLQAVQESGEALLRHCKKFTKEKRNAVWGKTKQPKTTGALELDFVLEDYKVRNLHSTQQRKC